MLRVEAEELFYTYLVDNQAIVVPETIDAIPTLAGREPSGPASIRATDEALEIWRDPLKPALG